MDFNFSEAEEAFRTEVREFIKENLPTGGGGQPQMQGNPEWNKKLDELFATRRPPLGHTNQARYLRAIREGGREFAEQIIRNTPHCADQSAALRCLRECVLWAEESVIHEGLV